MLPDIQCGDVLLSIEETKSGIPFICYTYNKKTAIKAKKIDEGLGDVMLKMFAKRYDVDGTVLIMSNQIGMIFKGVTSSWIVDSYELSSHICFYPMLDSHYFVANQPTAEYIVEKVYDEQMDLLLLNHKTKTLSDKTQTKIRQLEQKYHNMLKTRGRCWKSHLVLCQILKISITER